MRIRDLCKINAGDLRELAELMLRIRFDELFVAEVAYAICIPQCKELNLSRDDFFDAMGGCDANAEAEKAIVEDFSSFFRDDTARKMASRAVEVSGRVRNLLVTEAMSKGSTSSNTDSNSPGSSASTPVHSVSPNST